MSELSTTKKTELIFNRDDVKQRLNAMLGEKSAAFTTSVLSAIQANDMLKNADANTVYMAAMTAASLDLAVNPNLGQAYIIPYNIRQKSGGFKQVAQFQMGYKGFIQLALRSGQFKNISAAPVYEGQIDSSDPLKGFTFDWTAKSSDKVIGYAAYFQLLNGFEKTLYLTKKDIEAHAGKYSKTFKNKGSIWQQDFDSMAQKTVLKLLLSKYAPLSIEMQQAVIADQAIINDADTMDVTYVDNPKADEPKEDALVSRARLMIEAADNREALEQLAIDLDGIPEELSTLYDKKLKLF
jgi:recombination protein RecT